MARGVGSAFFRTLFFSSIYPTPENRIAMSNTRAPSPSSRILAIKCKKISDRRSSTDEINNKLVCSSTRFPRLISPIYSHRNSKTARQSLNIYFLKVFVFFPEFICIRLKAVSSVLITLEIVVTYQKKKKKN